MYVLGLQTVLNLEVAGSSPAGGNRLHFLCFSTLQALILFYCIAFDCDGLDDGKCMPYVQNFEAWTRTSAVVQDMSQLYRTFIKPLNEPHCRSADVPHSDVGRDQHISAERADGDSRGLRCGSYKVR